MLKLIITDPMTEPSRFVDEDDWEPSMFTRRGNDERVVTTMTFDEWHRVGRPMRIMS